MSRQRPTWWMYVVAASFLALIAFFYYMLIWGPGDLRGLHAVFEHGAMRVRVAEPDTPFAEAGLRAGDLVLSVDGLPVRNAYDWTTVQANIAVGRPQEWLISRDGQQLELYFTHQRATWQNRLAHAYLIHVGLIFGCFLLGILIGFRRPGDTAARIGSWFIMTASMVFGLPIGWAVLWRQLPLAVQAFLWIPEISRFVIEGIFVSLFAVFPRRLFRARWPWLVVWVPVLSTLPWRISAFSSMMSGHPANVPRWLFQAMNVRTMLYLVAGVVLLAVTYRRLADLNERRRVRVLMSGTAVSLSATIPVVWYFTFSGYELSPLYTLIISLFFPFTLACPLAFAYAILRHRVFDIQVIIRQGLQYALARGAVLGLVPALGGILLLDLAVNSRQPLADILAARGWIYAGLSGLALVAYWRRKPWLENLDRRFFRERYDAQRILRDVVGEIREARSFERVAPHVVARIEAAIHPEFVSVMVREAGERAVSRPGFSPFGPGHSAPRRRQQAHRARASSGEAAGGPARRLGLAQPAPARGKRSNSHARRALTCWFRSRVPRVARRRSLLSASSDPRSLTRERTRSCWKPSQTALPCFLSSRPPWRSARPGRLRSALSAAAAMTRVWEGVRWRALIWSACACRARWPAGTAWNGVLGAVAWARCTRQPTAPSSGALP